MRSCCRLLGYLTVHRVADNSTDQVLPWPWPAPSRPRRAKEWPRDLAWLRLHWVVPGPWPVLPSGQALL